MPHPALPSAVQRLIDEFSRLPGIGPKSASRLTFFLLRQDHADQIGALAEALRELRERTRSCSTCFNITDDDPCRLCSDSNRDSTVLCVVEEPLDVLAIERTGRFRGRYHVLGGVISPVEGVGPEDLRVAELVERARTAQPPLREIILATNVSLEGEATAMYVQRQLTAIDPGLRVTRLARGLPVGGDLEYADETTLARALEGRQSM
ncbi:MAG: recombination protein RecR [Anaerolineales bacterium]|nr:recombination protein RecR [Anaerolineales bacterium]